MEITLEQLASFFGWCAVINGVLLAVFSILMPLCVPWASRVHAKLLNVSESDVRPGYFSFLATYKLIVLSLNIVPFIVLKILLAT